MQWIVLLTVLGLGAAGGAVYVTLRTRRFSFVKKAARKHKALGWLLALVPVAAVSAFFLINVYSVIVVFLHLVAFWLICDGVGLIVRRAAKKRPQRYYAGAAAVALTVIYLGFGWFFAHHVFQTNYTFRTEKSLGGSLRVAALADSHLGITLNGESFSRLVDRINQTNPDVAVIVGDYVDDDTEKEDMLAACEALGRLKTVYGVYFVYGNHDKGYYQYRDFTSQELRQALSENGVTILEDESVLIDGRFYLIGRQDRTARDRLPAQELTAELDPSKYQILLDHQPNDYANEAQSGVDLVLSGHTHGGHMLPAGWIGLWTGANDRVYGAEVRQNTVFVVTSGVSGWAIPFKTGTVSEFLVIDIGE